MNSLGLYLLLIMTSKKSVLIGAVLNVGAILFATGQSISGDMTKGEFDVVVISALSITTIMLGFFMALFVTGTRANIRELYEKHNGVDKEIAVVKNTTELTGQTIKGELKEIRRELSELRVEARAS